MGRIAMCALPAAVQAFSQKERKTETSVAPLLMGRTAFCSEAEGRGRGSVCVSAQRGGSRRRTLVPLRRAPPPPSPQEPCLALEPVGAERGAWLSWGPGIWGPRSRFGRAASQAHGARRRPQDRARAGTFPTGLAEEGACVTQKPPGVRAGGEAGSGGGTGNFSISVPFERTENCEQGYGPDMCAGAAGGWSAHPSQWPERAGSAAPPPPVLPPLFTVRAGGWGRVGEEHAAGDWRGRASNPGPLTLSPACFGREGGCGRAGGKLPRIEVRNVVCGPQVPHRNPLRGPAHLCSPPFIHPCGLDVNSL